MQAALAALRRLPARDQLKVIAQILPEAVQHVEPKPNRTRSLRGIWKHLNFDLSAEEIDEVRRDAWANFPRDDF